MTTKFDISRYVFVIATLFGMSSAFAAEPAAKKAPATKNAASDDSPQSEQKAKGKSETAGKAVITPEQAAEHLGKVVVVEMTILGANNRSDTSPCFLNSKKDHRDEKNFTAIIFPDGLKKFREAKIDDPAIHFFNKKVRVTGTIELHKEKPQIKISDPKQIEIMVEPTK